MHVTKRMGGGAKGGRPWAMVIGASVALALLAFACAPAEEPTATPTTAPVAAAPTATSAPAVAAPTATSAPVAAAPTATSPAAATRPTATPVKIAGVQQPERYKAGARPEMTPELIAKVPQMTPEEVFATFPASYPPDWEYKDIKRGGLFRMAITFDISTWDTRRAASGGTTSVGNMVYERLVQYEQGVGRDPNNPAIVPDMAESWEFNEDGTKLTFKLRQDMHWGDMDDPFQKGPQIVAQDLVYTITQYRDNSVQAGAYRTVESVEAPDKYTLVLNFKSPSFFILPFLASKDGLQFNPYLAKADRIEHEIVGPGPFIVTEAKKSIEIRTKRNPNHFWKDDHGNPLPYLDEVQLLIVPDITTRIALFRTKRVDYSASVVSSLRDIHRLLLTNPDLQVTAVQADARGWVISPQLNNPMLQDVNVRRALTLALNTKGVSDVIWEGNGVPSDPKYEWWHYRDTFPSWDEDMDKWWGPYQNHYDLAKAKELWAQGGLGDISLEIPYYAYGGYIADMLALAVDDWSGLGITLKPRSQDYSNYNSSLQHATYEELILSWQQQAYDPVGIALTRLRSDGPGNRENVNDPELDALVDQITLTNDPAKQRELVQKMRDIYNDQVYFMSFPDNAFGFTQLRQPWVKGIRGGQNAYLSYYYQGPVLRTAWLDK